MRFPLLVLLLVDLNFHLFAQIMYEGNKEEYPFIVYNQNVIVYNGDKVQYDGLYKKITDMALKGQGKVSILHIGDSHIQADYLSGTFRKHLQTYFKGSVGGRGFIFPYKTANTNNPTNFRVKTKGHWTSCKCVETNHDCNLGLSCIAVTSSEPNSTLTIAISDEKMQGYDFDKIMVFHEFGPDYFEPQILYPEKVKAQKHDSAGGFTTFEFEDNLDSIVIGFKKTLSTQTQFTLQGINFDSNDAGIIYHTVGVNGARVDSYLSCPRFKNHLASLSPDWIMIALGTNDSYTNSFDAPKFETLVDSLILQVKQAAPQAAIMWALPGDHFMKGRGVNPNIIPTIGIIKKSCTKHNVSFWDYHAVMGGEWSIADWRKAGLAHTDNIHYTQKGYEYQAYLLFDAFMKGYDEYLTQQLQK